ncbi:MAG TPA: DNA-directed RNA polymerase subunit beta' [Candidatus Borkfalkia excrementigallinarum]|uniref:DNA-directed RNA polymerase subunit beta' n=1 Tax=Candidatus Borkfalkia excrementigallinarum TaxID=2838506 RepID=A0A9D1ZWX0_9FIRM|nr:DNA-directed RNA polymerase subunit beta' [Candidatus Borkfalkia excrementigallinarum]
MYELNDFDSIQIGVASPEKIREWSYGEVTKPETINYRTQKPEKDGLFCEKIFGPTKDWECHCGKYKRIRYKGIICEKCGVEVTRAKVRRERMGHIELAAPVSHIWYFRGVPSRIGLLLDMGPKQLEQVIYFAAYVVLDPGKISTLTYKQVINDKELREIEEQYGDESVTGLKVGMGAEAIRELLQAIDLDKESKETRDIIENNQSGAKRLRAVKRIEIIEAFRKSGNRPEWMILTVLPVIPPELRPMVQLDGGRFATSDLNDLYRRVINRNNRLKRLMELGAPDMIVKNEKRMLQEAVDALIDNGRRGKAISGPSNRELKSLSGLLRGKQGRFRQNLLGKRVDYSGRSVIVVGPELKLYQCGLPKEMAIELFKPFIMKKLVESGQCHNIKSAKRAVEKAKANVWDVLEGVIKEHPVLLNRAPTLHRLSIQAFEPVLIEGRAIKIHPLVCGAFNADFDGDQMAVHVPLSIEAQAEARFLMLSSNNILKLSDGKPVMTPTQDMILGAYYLTIVRRYNGRWYDKDHNEVPEGTEGAEQYHAGIYTSEDEAVMAYQTKVITLQDEIFVRRTVKLPEGKFTDEQGNPIETVTGRVKTTVGRIIYNEAIPQDLGFVPRETKEDYLQYEISGYKKGDDGREKSVPVDKKMISKIVDKCFKTGGAPKAADVLDKIKALGFKYSTIGALTTSVFDMHIPDAKNGMIADAEKKVETIEKKFARGLLKEEERYNAVVGVWKDTTDAVTAELRKDADDFNPIWMMANSGARGSIDQIKQLAGMRGLMVNPQGKMIEIPVKSCFREGLTVLEYFISSHGGRKGLADTALKTADSGYLTRRLVDVSQDVIVREDDCCAGKKPRGMKISAIVGPNGEIESLHDRLVGRFVSEDVVNPATGEVLVPVNEMITEEKADEIVAAGIKEVSIRSVFTCTSRHGVCAKCYGKNMATGKPIQVGEAVGTIAAQSIGEPGTQLTMRTFHTGGIAATGDITQGLPRVEELFEARKPKGVATLCEVAGVAYISEQDNQKHISIRDEITGTQKKEYVLPFNAELKIKHGDKVEPGTQLNGGSVNPQDILRIQGVKGVQDYILHEVQSVYRSQGVDINDKHVEIIVRQMMRKVRIENCGDTEMLPGELVDMFTFEDENERAIQNGGRPATAKRVLLGITKAALSTDSFLSAASFQETARVLTEAAIKSKVDPLIGLKENVIIGKLIPAGTGVRDYKNMSPQLVTGHRESDSLVEETQREFGIEPEPVGN